MIIESLYRKEPQYDMCFEQTIQRLTVHQGGTLGYAGENIRIDSAKFFQTKYEAYMYAVLLGMRRKIKYVVPEDHSKTKFIPISSWKPESILQFIIAGLISQMDINLDSFEKITDERTEEIVSKLKSEMEAYANGGFQIIKEKMDSQPDYFNDEFALLLLMDISLNKT